MQICPPPLAPLEIERAAEVFLSFSVRLHINASCARKKEVPPFPAVAYRTDADVALPERVATGKLFGFLIR